MKIGGGCGIAILQPALYYTLPKSFIVCLLYYTFCFN
jgi:hypothetical protein